MKLAIHPLTPDRLPALEDLFGKHGPVSRCWCMYWRIGADYRQRPPAANKAAFCELVESGPPPGLLAFDGDLAVGWCQLTPRDDLPGLDRARRLKRAGFKIVARRVPARPIMRYDFQKSDDESPSRRRYTD